MGTTELANERYLSITTFKRDGTPVSTPVWVAADDGTLLVHSEANSWKVKRIRRDGHVRIAPCNARGIARGEAVDADATIVEETATVSKLLARKLRPDLPGVRAVHRHRAEAAPPGAVTVGDDPDRSALMPYPISSPGLGDYLRASPTRAQRESVRPRHSFFLGNMLT